MKKLFTVDALVIKDKKILLIQRKFPPFARFFALPGGMIDKGETTRQAVIREVKEETGFTIKSAKKIAIYQGHDRDPRGWSKTTVYFIEDFAGTVNKETKETTNAQWFNLNKLPKKIAFDHRKIIADYLKTNRVVVAMSGGVDSSVAAALLKKQGYRVIGIFLKFWHPPKSRIDAKKKCHADLRGQTENVCCSQEALCQARRVADILKIPFYVLDASKEFKKQVVDYYTLEYEKGRTPNPCVMCNQFIKFGWLLRKAKELGAEYLATGHYARIANETLNSKPEILNKFKTQNSKIYHLLSAKDKKKDQSYFLWQLTQEQLKHILFPIGDYKKSEVRQLAKKWRLPMAEKKDSQDICFIPDRNNVAFLRHYTKKLNQPGEIIDLQGNILGQHKGLCYYTIGQRHGLEGVQLKFPIKSKIPNSKSKKLQATSYKLQAGFQSVYVVRLDIEKNQLVVGTEKDLYSKELIAENVNWINSCYMLHVACCMKCKAKIRYGAKNAECRIKNVELKNSLKVIFDKPQRAITPGQSIVFYSPRGASAKWGRGEEVVGGGIIKNKI